jgi:hypothetical protein
MKEKIKETKKKDRCRWMEMIRRLKNPTASNLTGRTPLYSLDKRIIWAERSPEHGDKWQKLLQTGTEY